VNDLISELDLQRGGNLSSAIRVFVLREVAGNRHPRRHLINPFRIP
jgi:predicted DNA-binding ribbon-helix-helix protein